MMSSNHGDIIVVVTKSRNLKTGKMEEIVSHGIDIATDMNVILPTEHPSDIGAVFDMDLREYVLRAPAESKRVGETSQATQEDPKLSLAERLHYRNCSRDFIMMMTFDQKDITPHIQTIRILAAHIPKYWNVADSDRTIINDLFSFPKIVGGSVRFLTSINCNEADQLRLAELIQEIENKSHDKDFLLPDGGKIHCNLALGGEKQLVIKRYQAIIQSSPAPTSSSCQDDHTGERESGSGNTPQGRPSLTERLARRQSGLPPDPEQIDSPPGNAPRSVARHRG